MASLNQCSFIGNLGKDPEIKSMQSGDKVANFSVACSETWKDKATGEKKERTDWIPVVVWGPLAGVVERFLRKGSKVFVQGKFKTRKWQDQSGNDRYSTEIVLQGPGCVLTMLDGAKQGEGQSSRREPDGSRGSPPQNSFSDDLDDDIPFITDRGVW